MARNLGSTDIRDTGTYTYTKKLRTDGNRVFHYVNSLDQDVTVTFYGTYEADTDYSDATQIGSITVGTGTTDVDTLTDSWDRIKIDVSASTAPTSGTFSARVMG